MAATLEQTSPPQGQVGRPRREGSPWTGLWAVVAKDMADHLTSVRMRILELLIVLTASGTVYVALQNLRGTTGSQDRFLFLRLFTTGQDPLPAFVGFLSFLVPLIAIALAFDAINGEFNQRTLSRVLAQPIYRDALLLGKFLAGLFTLALVMAAIWLLIMGLGILGLGVPPTGEEVARTLIFLLATIFYGGIWLVLAMLFSTLFRQPATAALASIAVWLFFMIFWGIVADILAAVFRPVQVGLVQEVIAQAELQMALARVSPNTLYAEAMIGLLQPSVRSFGILLPSQLQGALLGAPLPLGQSVLLIWPQLTGLIAATILLFAVCYVVFQRQEIRA
ncbi:ABC transporter permease [Litorilinea aerophila]|uniref:ABC transporter permease n=1 Tax=Litorilinea aerophila TaxID=1204385 RepID=A0A540VGS9_9CHLR|nr:ABC transporter permease [Litorilinea aerophila]MCC9076354.1 ABC transporter permease [Litorilinea aerophila]OUC07214.1 ABC transporter permease [Litorilinea aerophila]GIV78088.1 MAG: ABC transporter permease [Litorilinea sp.]